MEEYIKNLCENKKILILGFGREGRATYDFIKKNVTNPDITVADLKPQEVEEKVIFGAGYMDSIEDYDIVFKSPGVVLPKAAGEYKTVITSEIAEFIGIYRKNIIGVTGTKGKSTTSSLIYHTLKTAHVPVVFGGNIGVPAFMLIDEINRLKADGQMPYIVLELSCHQLEYCNVSPKTAVYLNLYEEHLDHYGTFDKYKAAKDNIYLHQKEGDKLYTGIDFSLEGIKPGIDYNEYSVSYKGKKFSLPVDEWKLIGEHNCNNAALVYAICSDLGIPDDIIKDAFISFEPLAHRLAFVGETEGIKYYDDSISTIGEAAISAIKSIPGAQTALIGGMDRGIDYTDLEVFLLTAPIKNVIFMYETGYRILNELINYGLDNEEKFDLITADSRVSEGLFEPVAEIVYDDNKMYMYASKDLEEAVAVAKTCTDKGKTVILSPAAASYGYFKNFEERGEKFKELIQKK